MLTEKINFANLYWLNEDSDQKTLVTYWKELNSGEVDYTKIDDVFSGKNRGLSITCVPDEGSVAKDFVYCSVVLRLISEKVYAILCQNNFTGWSTYPITLLNKQNASISGYTGLAITGKCGPELKQVREKKHRLNYAGTELTEVFVGYYFDPKTWDGSDFFSPEGTAIIIVTDRVKRAFEEANVTNVSFTPLTEVESLS